jgi:putative transposase
VSRPLRLEHPGAIWHITSRGNNREAIYLDVGDRLRWLSELEKTVRQNDWVVHAYALMDNHYHLLIETPRPTLSRGMRQLNGVYAQAFNRQHHRVGHVFQGRFHSELVERESHLLELSRYVVLNPVRAHLIGLPEQWTWSNYRATAGLEDPPAWLNTGWTLSNFGGSRARYATFVAEGSLARINLRRRPYVGSESFVREAREAAAARAVDGEVPARYWKAPSRPLADVLAEMLRALGVDQQAIGVPGTLHHQRRLVAYGLRQYAGASGRTLAPLLGVSRGHACSLARAGEQTWPSSGLAPVS